MLIRYNPRSHVQPHTMRACASCTRSDRVLLDPTQRAVIVSSFLEHRGCPIGCKWAEGLALAYVSALKRCVRELKCVLLPQEVKSRYCLLIMSAGCLSKGGLLRGTPDVYIYFCKSKEAAQVGRCAMIVFVLLFGRFVPRQCHSWPRAQSGS